jgi:hypothetical protein
MLFIRIGSSLRRPDSVGALPGPTGDGVGDAAVTRNSIHSTIHKNEPDENFVRLASS